MEFWNYVVSFIDGDSQSPSELASASQFPIFIGTKGCPPLSILEERSGMEWGHGQWTAHRGTLFILTRLDNTLSCLLEGSFWLWHFQWPFFFSESLKKNGLNPSIGEKGLNWKHCLIIVVNTVCSLVIWASKGVLETRQLAGRFLNEWGNFPVHLWRI